MEDFEKELQDFESLLEDPSVSEIVEKARFINTYLAEYPMTEQESRQAIAELNQQWKAAELDGEEMAINGDAWVCVAGYDLELDKHFVDDSYTRFVNQRSNVGGFTFISNTEMDENGTSLTQEVFLSVKSLIHDELGYGQASVVDFVVSLKEDTHILYEGVSPQRAEKWLEYYYPEEKAEIIQASLESADEAETVLALRDFSLPLEGLTKESILELKQHFEVFTRETLQLEHHVPYLFQTCGTIKTLGTTAKGKKKYISTEALTIDRAFITVQDIYYEKSDDKQRLEPIIMGAIIGSNKHDLTLCKIPLKELYDFESIRTIISEQNREVRNKSTK